MRRTLRGSVARLQALFDWGDVPTTGWEVVHLSPAGTLVVHGAGLELRIDTSDGYASEAGTEYPMAGLARGVERILPHG